MKERDLKVRLQENKEKGEHKQQQSKAYKKKSGETLHKSIHLYIAH